MAKGGKHERHSKPLAVLTVFVLSGFLFVAASVSAGGEDLRPSGGDVASLLQERARRIDVLRDDARALQSDIDALSSSVPGDALNASMTKVKKLQPPTGLTKVEGPAIRVTLTDAPRSVNPEGVDPNQLVVHQQDIQAYVNALWIGGAEAISLQGQRLISTSGIKCVGNTVVLDGVPYSPPYVIEAVGNTVGMNSALAASPETVTYAAYAQRYQLGLAVEFVGRATVPAYAGPVSLQYASATS